MGRGKATLQARPSTVDGEQTPTMQAVNRVTEIRHGLFVEGMINDEKINLLIDTGSTITIISQKALHKVKRGSSTDVHESYTRLLQADGTPIQVYGETNTTLKIGTESFNMNVVVADIDQDGILGMDFLQDNNSAINCESGLITINGVSIQCTNTDDTHKIAEIHQFPMEIPEHLHDIYERTKENTQGYEMEIATLLVKYEDVFSKGDKDIGRTDKVKHSIHTTCLAPIRQCPRRAPMGQREEIEKQVNDMLERGIITHSASPWSSPIVLVDKKDGTKRFCVDYRMLNKHTIKDSFPLPRIDESIDYLAGAKYYCTLDLASGYWQVPLDEDAKQKSAFVVPGGLFQFEVMPFGLCNAPSTFERLMENVMIGLQHKILLIYLDDIIVYGPTIEEVISRLETVLQRLREAKLKLKPKKCHLFCKQVLYLGHVISPDGTSTDPQKIETIKTWTQPKTQTEVRSFLGLASYYRRYIKGFSSTAKPLHALTEKDKPFEWTDECNKAFNDLKEKLMTSPILAYPEFGQPYILDTDASNFGIGAVLSQVQQGTERVIAYGSRTLNRAERNYCVTRRELLAVVHFLKHFKHYLYGQEVLVRTDHGALRWLLDFKSPEGQIARWIEIISQYKLTLQHRPGRVHSNADGLSRRPCTQCGRLKDICNDKQ